MYCVQAATCNDLTIIQSPDKANLMPTSFAPPLSLSASTAPPFSHVRRSDLDLDFDLDLELLKHSMDQGKICIPSLVLIGPAIWPTVTTITHYLCVLVHTQIMPNNPNRCEL